MPIRNGERFLQEAVDSVLAQTFGDLELIAIDDGSSDSTPAILAEAARRDSRVTVVRQAPTGLVDALNRGIAATRAPFIARLDADDI